MRLYVDQHIERKRKKTQRSLMMTGLQNIPDSAFLPLEKPKRCYSALPTYLPNLDTLQRSSRHRVRGKTTPVHQDRARCPSAGQKIYRCRRKKISETKIDLTLPEHGYPPRCQTSESEFNYLEIEKYLQLDEKVYNELGKEDDSSISKSEFSNVSQQVYHRACKQLKITPASTFTRCLPTSRIVMRYKILNKNEVKACAAGLINNSSVEHLDLTGNEINPEGAEVLMEIFTENIFITELLLGYNKLGSEGAREICNILVDNHTIRVLDLSGNGLQDYDAIHFADLLEENVILKELYIGHNEFQEKGGEILGRAIANNETLNILDLSWNHIRQKGAVAICKGIKHNTNLHTLDLSWNGFHIEGSKAMSAALLENTTLLTLDLSSNRIDLECVIELSKGLRLNKTLATLKLNDNSVTTDGILKIIKCLEEHPDMGLQTLEVRNQCIDKEVIVKMKELREKRPLHFFHGTVLHKEEALQIEGADDFLDEDPMTVLMEYMRLMNFRLIDLFSILDRDGDKSLTRAEFKEGLLLSNIPLSAKSLDILISKLDIDGDGEVDYKELIEGQREHRRRLAKIMKQSKNLPFEETELGRVSLKLQALMSFRKRKLTSLIQSADGSGMIENGLHLEDVIRTAFGTHKKGLPMQLMGNNADLRKNPRISVTERPSGVGLNNTLTEKKAGTPARKISTIVKK